MRRVCEKTCLEETDKGLKCEVKATANRRLMNLYFVVGEKIPATETMFDLKCILIYVVKKRP